MRKSVERQRSEAEARLRRQNRRLILWSLVPMTAVACLVWFGAHYYDYRQEMAAINEQQATREAEWPKVLAALTERRLEREANENTAIRESIYKQMIAGVQTPPDIGDTQCNHLKQYNDPASRDVFISKSYCVWPLDFVPELESVYGVELKPEVAAAFQRMVIDASNVGHDIRATSGYRSYADQAATFVSWLNSEGFEAAESKSAYAGYSEHQTGLAVDVATLGCSLDCFATTPAYDWMLDNAHRYGFVERYPYGESQTTGYGYESWHWRYIGPDAATDYYESNARTLEHFWQFATE